MKIIVLNGSPHPNGNTAALVNAFVKGAQESNHDITVILLDSFNVQLTESMHWINLQNWKKQH